VYPASGARIIMLEDVVNAVQSQARIFLVKADDCPQKFLVSTLALAGRTLQPGIVAASGNPQGQA
jgi:hypothetical protein